MIAKQRIRVGAWLVSLSGVVAGAQGCILDGDASLGSDGQAAGSAGKNEGGSATMSHGGKSSAGGSSGSSGSKAVSGSAGKTGVAGSEPAEAGAPAAYGGEASAGGAANVSAICMLPIETGPCDAAIESYAFDASAGKCVSFTYGGCEGNANRFTTQTDCQAACEDIACPSYLQTDKVFMVLPLNRPERACVDFERPIVVSCSQLLDPSQTVPTNYGSEFCVTRDGQLYRAETTLPKANGWQDCSPAEAEIVAEAPSCSDL